MGTRGAFGFYVDGETKVHYNQMDSYPSYGGRTVAEELSTLLAQRGVAALREQARAIALVSNEVRPSEEEQRAWSEYFAVVSEGTKNDWYALTRRAHGSLTPWLDRGQMLGAENFLDDSLFCEWAYIANLDDEVLECYKGFQKAPHSLGRYGARRQKVEPAYAGESSYYPVALERCYSFAQLMADRDAVIADMLAWENEEEAA